MLFSTAGCNAAPLDLCLRSVLSGHSARLCCLPCPAVQATTASIRAAAAKIRIEAAKMRLPSRLNLHSAPPLPAVSFLGGFQTPAGPEKTCAHSSGRHLKPITKAAVWVTDRNAFS